MSKRELVDAYAEGRISRRMFVRGLVTVGVTVTAAVMYADQLAVGAPTSRARQAGDLYGAPAAATAIETDQVRFTG